MAFPKKNFPETFFFFLIVGFLSYWLYVSRISLFPSFIHAWTQSDRYALALGFLNNGFDFFHPQTFNLITVNGITQVDFPIHEYVVALLMKLSGIHEPVVFRMYTLCYGVVGLYFIFRLVKDFGGTFFHGLFVALFIMTCPVFTYYLDGFLPSIPSFANAMIGYYFFFRYKRDSVRRDFILSILFFTLAALARLPFIIFLFAICAQQLLDYLRRKKMNRPELSLMAGGLGFVLLYLFYNIFLAKKYGSQFLLALMPAESIADFKELFSRVIAQWKYEYFSTFHYYTLVVILVFTISFILIKKTISENKFMLTQLVIAFCGSALYLILMTQQFPEHDYYFIDSFYPVVALLLVYCILRIQTPSPLSKIFFTLVTCLMIYFFSTATSKVQDERYKFQTWDRTEITRQNFTGAEHFIDSIGISKDAKMLVLDAYTTNTSLILMNRKGHTLLWTTKENIDTFLKKDVDYVVMQNCFLPSDIIHFDPEIIAQLEKVADNGTISIYRKEKKENRTLDEFLGIKKETTLYNCFNDFESDSSCKNADLSKRSSENKFDGTSSLLVDGMTEDSPTFHFVKTDLPFVKSTQVLIHSMIFRENDMKDIYVVASLIHGNETYFYRDFSMNQYIGNTTGWQEIMFQFVLPEIKSNEDRLSIYFSNKSKSRFYLDDFRLTMHR